MVECHSKEMGDKGILSTTLHQAVTKVVIMEVTSHTVHETPTMGEATITQALLLTGNHLHQGWAALLAAHLLRLQDTTLMHGHRRVDHQAIHSLRDMGGLVMAPNVGEGILIEAIVVVRLVEDIQGVNILLNY